MANDSNSRIENATRAAADSAIADRISALEVTLAGGAVSGAATSTMLSPVPEKRSFLKDAAKGLAHVAKVIWQVPAARGAVATLLIRFGIPGTLVAIGMAVGEKLAQ